MKYYEPDTFDEAVKIAKRIVSMKRIVSIDKMDIKTNKREIVQCRQLVYSLLRNHFEKQVITNEKIANVFEQDHAMVNHSVKVVENDCSYNKRRQMEYEKLNEYFEESMKHITISDMPIIKNDKFLLVFDILAKIKKITNKRFWKTIYDQMTYKEIDLKNMIDIHVNSLEQI